MSNGGLKRARAIFIGVMALIATSNLAPTASAQRGEDWEWPGNSHRLNRLNAGTYVTVRTTQSIASDRTDGRIFRGVVDEDVWDDYRRLAVPAIPRGSRVDLVVRTAPDGDLILDLESLYAHGQRYALDAAPERIESDKHDTKRPEFVAGGAILGTIIGAIANGGKGAAVGAAAGAATGLGLSFRGHSVRVPAGSLLHFRLDRGLDIGTHDTRNHRVYPSYSGSYPPSQRR
jgi:hypothetical protein